MVNERPVKRIAVLSKFGDNSYIMLTFVVICIFREIFSGEGNNIMFENFGQQSAVSIVVHLLFFAITWWTLMGLRIDLLIKPGKTGHAKVLMILLTIAIGSAVSNFFLNYLIWAQQLQFMF